MGVAFGERTDAGAAQCLDVRSSAQGDADVLGQHTDVGARRALDLGPVHVGSIFDRLDLEAVHHHRPRGALDLDPLAGQLVQAAATHLDC